MLFIERDQRVQMFSGLANTCFSIDFCINKSKTLATFITYLFIYEHTFSLNS